MKKIISTCLFLFFLSYNTVQAQSLESYLQQAEEAENNQNAPKAAEAYGHAIELCRESNNSKQLVSLLCYYGIMLCYAGNYEKATISLTEAYEKALLSNPPDKKTEAKALLQLGMVYFFMDNWDDALSYYQKAKIIATELNEKQGLSIIDNNIANIYQKRKNYTQAIELYNHTLELQKTIQDSATICNTYFNIATCYEELNNEEKALSYFEKSKAIAHTISDTEIEALNLLHIGKYLSEKGHIQEATEKVNQSENLAIKGGYKQVLEEIYKQKSLILANAGNYKEAYETQQKLCILTDSLFNDKSVQTLRDFQVKYDTQEKEHQIALQKEQLQRENIKKWLLFLGIIICLIVLFFVNKYRELLRKRNTELRDMNATKDKFFSIISHDLKNPALAQKNALQQLVENGQLLDEKSLAEYYGSLLKSSESQVELLYNLLDWARVQTNRIPYNPTNFDLSQIMMDEIELMQMSLSNKHITLTKNFTNNILVNGDHNMAATAFRNLLTNAIKFTNNGGQIDVNITQTNQDVWVTVHDNGVGMSPEKVNNLFRLDKQQSTAGTQGESGSGLGLVVCKNFVERNGGTFTVESTEGKGTTFTFTMKKVSAQ